jgi:hypothetical protein
VATPIRTTNDLLLARQLPSTEFVELFTRVRVAGLAFLPVTGEEISALLARTTVVEGYLSETAELKALRESLEMYRMSQGLQLPAEAVWYEDVVRALLRALRAEWTSDADVQLARTRSSWLLQELDLRGWSHGDKQHQGASEARFQAALRSLTRHATMSLPRSAGSRSTGTACLKLGRLSMAFVY